MLLWGGAHETFCRPLTTLHYRGWSRNGKSRWVGGLRISQPFVIGFCVILDFRGGGGDCKMFRIPMLKILRVIFRGNCTYTFHTSVVSLLQVPFFVLELYLILSIIESRFILTVKFASE